jgi:erythromycin esterase-like protein
MAETVRALEEHLRATGRSGKLVVWAHNSHLGDARATEASESGELNLGQLLRESHGREALLVGFTTYSGSVTAASDWDGPTERKTVRPALPGSWEELLHHTGEPAFYLPLRGATAPELKLERLERFIGVVYRPDTERQSHYYHARLADQYDALVHYDATEAVEPLELAAPRHPEEVPETYPTGV